MKQQRYHLPILSQKKPSFSRPALAGRRGAVLILAALLMTGLLGMTGVVIDLGLVYMYDGKLQAAADAAAYAAASALPAPVGTAGEAARLQATALAEDYVARNSDGEAIVESVEFGDIFNDTQTGQHYASVRVSLTRPVDYLFAPIVGVDGTQVSREAKVRVEAVTGGMGLAPIGISSERRNANPPKTLPEVAPADEISFSPGSEDVVRGFFGFLDLGDTGGGAAKFEDHFTNGYFGELVIGSETEIGENIESQTGVLAGPARDSFQARYYACTHTPSCTGSGYVSTCPRIVYLIVYEIAETKPRYVYRAVGIAPYILTSYNSSSKVLSAVPIQLRVTTGRSQPLNDLNYDFSLFRYRLVE